MDSELQTWDDLVAFIERRKSEGAVINLTPRAKEMVRAGGRAGGPFAVGLLVKDDGRTVLVDLDVPAQA